MSQQDRDVVDALRAELTSRAEAVAPSRYDFAGRAIGAGRVKRRIRRRAVGALAALVLVGGPGTAAVVAGRDDADVRPEPAPTVIATPTPTSTSTPAPSATRTPERLDAAALPLGEPARLPYVVGGVLHDGDVALPLELPGPPVSVARLGQGWVVETLVESAGGDLAPGALVHVERDGAATVLSDDNVRGVAVSNDGGRLVWADGPRDGSRTALHGTLGPGDAPQDALTIQVDGAWDPVGFLDDFQVVLRPVEGTQARSVVRDLRRWDADLRERQLPPGMRALSADSGLISATTGEETAELMPCTALLEWVDLTPVWESCEWSVTATSYPARVSALAKPAGSDGISPGEYAVLWSHSGQWRTGWTGNFRAGVWEDDSHVLFFAAAARDEPHRFALVRCDVGGACERVTEMRSVDPVMRDDWEAVVGR
ncbi:hypothetical protein [Motilibacter aurantiacus]|uniref:hypothetical protein n=1 Tax=Motilibacter aurantiacus TaxID=2714955 RepID=UPI00140E1904|nr:hypothetical protein [Motilibacter aurantiacus]NHC46643.1 hypothetical protein [Motilibacter aurantiacus]